MPLFGKKKKKKKKAGFDPKSQHAKRLYNAYVRKQIREGKDYKTFTAWIASKTF